MLALLAATPLHAQLRPAVAPSLAQAAPVRLIDLIDVDERESQVDITLQFNCSLRYSGHSPTSEGAELRLRLRPDADCATAAATELATEIPPISGPTGTLTSARLESSLGGEVTLTLTFARPESFVLAQGASARGLRIRLLRSRAGKPRILVADRGDIGSSFAVNLESRRQPFEAPAIDAAKERLQTNIFVSEIDAAGEKWYRLRAGPFDQRSVAESVLRAAQKTYPRAWLAVGDDSVTNDPNAVTAEPPLPAVEPAGTDTPLPEPERAALLGEARKAMRAHHYADAVQLLTKLQRQPEFPERSQAQELLGLARERSGEVAQAKAEYEEYLRRYPNGPAAERIRARLRILRSASATARSGGLDVSSGDGPGWRVSGGVTQLYERESFGSNLNGPLYATVVQNAVFTDADLFAHRDGDRFAAAFRTSFGYAKNFLPREISGADDRVRITTAFFDLNDRLLGLRTRVGRQTATADGIYGIFDGGSVAYQFHPGWTVRGTYGMPIDDAGQGVQTDRRFQTVALAYGPEMASWTSGVYFTRQQFEGIRDRQAVGAQLQYAVPTHSLVSYVDYDTGFHSLNAAVLLGTVQLPARWQLTLDVERRNAPLLSTRNALIGQPGTTFRELRQTLTDDEIAQLARDRTPELSTYMMSATKQLGERFELMFDVMATKLADTPASGGVEAFPGTDGTDISYETQLLGARLFGASDFNQLIVRYDKTALATTTGAAFIGRYPLLGAWRIGPRLLAQRRHTDTGYTQTQYAPAARLDYQRNGHILELEGGAELGRNPQELQIGDTTRLYVSLGYRINF